MLSIESEQIIITDHLGNRIVFDVAFNGPDDPIIIRAKLPSLKSEFAYERTPELVIEINRQELESLQYAVVNYLNTGYFDREA